jgi:PTS system cellobiose-specific IIA component
MEDSNFQAVAAKLVQAQEEISSAHHVQTEVIQAEARGDPVQITLLLTHAQDTLMIAMSELQMARHMVDILKKLKEPKQ